MTFISPRTIDTVMTKINTYSIRACPRFCFRMPEESLGLFFDFFTRAHISVIITHMTERLNFYRSLLGAFLALVSFWIILFPALTVAQNKPEEKDEFAFFEEGDKNPKKAAGKPLATPSAMPAAASPALSPEQKIEKLKADIRKSPQNAPLIMDLARELYNQGQYDKTTALLWKHVDKIDRQSILLLAKSHEKRKEAPDMVRAVNLLLSKNEKDFEAHTLMGTAHQLDKKSKEAIESFKSAIEANPQYEPAYLGLIDLYEKREPPNLYELRILYQDMVQNIGSRSVYLLKLCEINTLDGTFEAGIRSCNEAIIKDPKKADAYVYLGLSQKGMGEEGKADKTFQKTATKFPSSEFALYQYGKSLEDHKNFLEAMKVYKKATEANDKAARSWLGLATSSFEVRKYDVSLIAYKNACRLDKKTAVAFRRATTLLRNQKNSDWVRQFENSSDNCTF